MTFDAFGFIPPINKAIQRINYVTATPIQQQCIPLVLEGKDVLASAQQERVKQQHLACHY